MKRNFHKFNVGIAAIAVVLLAAVGYLVVHHSHAAGADINGDGTVGIADLSILATHYGQTGQTFSTGDLSGDGIVGIADLSILASAWGMTQTAVCTGTVPIATTDNAQTIVNAHASGTAYLIKAGTHQGNFSVTPKSGDTYCGEAGAIVDGGGTVQYAISGSANNVTIRNLTIQNYNAPSQQGSITGSGSGWTIDKNHVTKSGAAGINTSDGATVTNNLLDYNAEEGYACHEGSTVTTYTHNEIAFNNPNAAYDWGFEAGGGKCSNANANNGGVVFRDNYSHDNHGPGLWNDISVTNVVFDSNIVVNNYGPGIFQEISYNFAITNNYVASNGLGDKAGWLWDAGILIAASGSTASQPVSTISGNTVVNNYNGVGLIQQNRGSSSIGPWYVQNISIHDNNIISTGASGGTPGNVGAVQDLGDNAIFTSRSISWSHNAYHFPWLSGNFNGGNWWQWNNTFYNQATWKGLGFDTSGTFDTNMTVPAQPGWSL